MGEQPPSPGQVSPDGLFVWDGSQWNPITTFRWEPTPTTRRMQLLAGGYLVAAGLLTTLLTFFTVPAARQSAEETLREQNPALTPDEIRMAVDFAITIGLAVAVLVGAVYVMFGLMTLFRRWGWLFYADLVVLGLSGVLGVGSGVISLATRTAGPIGLLIPNLVLSLAALALFTWLLLTRIRGSVWGARKVPNL
ncbi:MAG: hypothetical protein M3Z98_08880 [Candidatus Dormibacteraeota bacterium]|nr:hypothetical protein [Candidatus Dormibacteraeota bacterium]